MRKWEASPGDFTHSDVDGAAEAMLNVAKQYRAGISIAATGQVATVLINSFAPDEQSGLFLVEKYHEILLECVKKHWEGKRSGKL